MTLCEIIKQHKHHLCWTASSGWDLSPKEMCSLCVHKFNVYLQKKSLIFKDGQLRRDL